MIKIRIQGFPASGQHPEYGLWATLSYTQPNSSVTHKLFLSEHKMRLLFDACGGIQFKQEVFSELGDLGYIVGKEAYVHIVEKEPTVKEGKVYKNFRIETVYSPQEAQALIQAYQNSQ